jgi:Protein of unknown function (DUF3318)
MARERDASSIHADSRRARPIMSQHDDAFKAQKRATAHKLSTPHMRALRKELLIARADVERMEIAQATTDLRTSIKRFSFLNFLMPGRSSRRGTSGGASGIMHTLSGLLSGGGLNTLLTQYPVVSSLASLLLAKPLRAGIARGAKPALKWGGLGLVAWEAFRIWQQMKTPQPPQAPQPPADTTDPTVF